ncbi:MAG: VOC family protein [Clostridiales bacterium]|jgi:glyoxylase I family protein|nr:VOC family protein [Clostridiales bacterium]
MANINKKIAGLGFTHIALKVNDFDKSWKFYEEVLGMTPTVGWGKPGSRIQMFDIGDGGIVEMFEGGSDEIPAVGKYQHFAMCCEDVDAAYAAAIAGGAVSKIAPKDVPLDSHPYKMVLRIAFVYGPSGEELEFFTSRRVD